MQYLTLPAFSLPPGDVARVRLALPSISPTSPVGMAPSISVALHISESVAQTVLRRLLLVEALLAFAYVLDRTVGGGSWRLTTLVDLDGERSLGMWWSSVQLAVAGLLLLAVPHVRPLTAPVRRLLVLLGAGLVFLSLDEALGFHEHLTTVGRSIDWLPRFRGQHGIWVFAYGLVGIALLASFARPIRAAWVEHHRPATCFVLGLAILVLGAVGCEVVGYQFIRGRGLEGWYTVEVALEEFLEMAGGSVMLFGALLMFDQRPAAPTVEAVRPSPTLSAPDATPV